PDGEVIDGRGGDGGREFQVRMPESLVLYEAKSFTDRIRERSPNRRAQVQRSLVSAARHQPDAWHLVVPIDHNPDELRWFDRLRDDFAFVDRWRGQTWLEEQLAQHDDLLRYATADKLLEYVRQYKLETEALAGGVPALLDRHRALEMPGDTISPHWRPVIGSLADGSTVVELQPKHPAAAEQAPITFRITAAVPVDPTTELLRDRLRASMAFGTAAEIPGEYISEFAVTGPPELGLPGPEARLQRILISELPDTENLPTQTLAVHGPNSAFPIATLSFQTARRTVGQAGARLVARDHANCVELISEACLDRTLRIRLQALDNPLAPPASVLPSLRLMQALCAPNTLVLTVRLGQNQITETMQLPHVPEVNRIEDEVIGFVQNLAKIQDALHQPFPLPPTFTGYDLDLAARLVRLIAGEAVPWRQGSVTVGLDPAGVGEFKQQFQAGGALRVSWHDQEIAFGDHVLHTGPIYMIGAVTVNLDAIPDHPPPGDEVAATFDLVGDDWFHARLGTPPDEHPLIGEQAARGRVSYAPAIPDPTLEQPES
ncbi:MAG: hypothetical protein ABI418_16370, partial [Jatrophihabitantaceae bacterium]